MLVALVAKGDRAAFARIFDAYYNKVLSQALTYCRSYTEAEDAAQDIFLKIWDQREKLVAVTSFRDYLFILVRNKMIDALRKKAVAISRTAAVTQETPLSEDILLPDQQLDYRETYQLILRGVEELPPQQQQVFRMSRLEGKSNGEIAEALGIARTTVRWHIVMALNFLRTYVARHMGPFIVAGPAMALIRRWLEKN